ncbi:MAG: hypothetical protein R2710_16025 [Acidimicrobiales bacterium]
MVDSVSTTSPGRTTKSTSRATALLRTVGDHDLFGRSGQTVAGEVLGDGHAQRSESGRFRRVEELRPGVEAYLLDHVEHDGSDLIDGQQHVDRMAASVEERVAETRLIERPIRRTARNHSGAAPLPTLHCAEFGQLLVGRNDRSSRHRELGRQRPLGREQIAITEHALIDERRNRRRQLEIERAIATGPRPQPVAQLVCVQFPGIGTRSRRHGPRH